MNENNYTVYAHRFPDGMCYIGITKQRVEDRWQKNGVGYKGQPVYGAIELFGWENIEHIIIASGLDAEKAGELQKEWISQLDNKCWNVSKGGNYGGSPFVKFEMDGKKYTSQEIAAMSNVDGLTGHDITTRVNCRGWSLEEAMQKPKIQKGKKYEYRWNWYTSRELAEISPVGLSTGDILGRLHLGWDIERVVNQPKGVKQQPFDRGKYTFIYNGKPYKSYSLLQFSKVEGLNQHTLTNRIIRDGMSVEEALTKPLKIRNKKYEYRGKLYTTTELAELSPVDGLEKHNITDRLRSGWSVEDAVNKPKMSYKK